MRGLGFEIPIGFLIDLVPSVVGGTSTSDDGLDDSFVESRDVIRPATGKSLAEIVFENVVYPDRQCIFTEVRKAAMFAPQHVKGHAGQQDAPSSSGRGRKQESREIFGWAAA